MLSLFIFVIFFVLGFGVWGSDITTYSDGECKKSFNNLHAVNGYPDGVCTQLGMSSNGTPRTFQLARLDDGCAVTIYGANEGPDPCSSSLKIVAQIGTCYNASWVYYSIDGCVQPSASSIILPTTTPTPTSTSTPIATATVANYDASPTTTPISAPGTSHTGAVVGGITGGVAAFAVLLALTMVLLRRQYLGKPLPPPPAYELPDDHALIEAGQGSIMLPEKAYEMGRNSAFEYRVELPADPAFGDKKALHEYARVQRESTWI
ncbi:hypothetical protein CC80DRAFT_129864 [Byssothecium circinans]|uniref:Mid2 domain-containing protein n=1 Tax=Byssothecium circinans TaxID=147558 RepID=A0A6A5TR96_9PLEO|nr:hypothetical protein CC80DRAFT_129864 [Byssothecium circinans]